MTPGSVQSSLVPPMYLEKTTPYPANAFGLISLIYQPIITSEPAQIGLTPPTDLV